MIFSADNHDLHVELIEFTKNCIDNATLPHETTKTTSHKTAATVIDRISLTTVNSGRTNQEQRPRLLDQPRDRHTDLRVCRKQHVRGCTAGLPATR